MTGFYVRALREGHWQSLEIDALTNVELATFAASQPAEQGWRWAIRLAAWIRDQVGEEEGRQ